jgi:hypothetical protein
MGDVFGLGKTVTLAEPLILAAHDLSPEAFKMLYGLIPEETYTGVLMIKGLLLIPFIETGFKPSV